MTAREKRSVLVRHEVPPTLEGSRRRPSRVCSERGISLVLGRRLGQVRNNELSSRARNAQQCLGMRLSNYR